jgi:uncharacterized protein
MTPRFLDTNILLRLFTRDDEAKARLALALLQRVERGEEKVICDIMIVFETVFTLERRYKVSRERIRELVWNIVSMPGVQLAGKALCQRTLDVYVEQRVSFADAYTAVSMQARGLSEVYSWDTDFDDIPGITRLEPLPDLSTG